jgi:hypothetical protein
MNDKSHHRRFLSSNASNILASYFFIFTFDSKARLDFDHAASGTIPSGQLWRLWSRIPRFGFQFCTLLIFSHIAADMLLTSTPVSLLWPFESNGLSGHSGWGHVVHMVVFKGMQDLDIIMAAIGYLLVLRIVRSRTTLQRLLSIAKRRVK